jgi:hypothetical protein
LHSVLHSRASVAADASTGRTDTPDPPTITYHTWFRLHYNQIISGTGVSKRTWLGIEAVAGLHPEAAPQQLLFELPRAAPPRREGLTAVIQEAYIQGISTHSVDDPVRTMGMEGASKTQGSRPCGEIQDPGFAAVRRDRRVRESFLVTADRREVAVSLARCDLRQGSPRPPHRLGRGNRRGCGEHAWLLRWARHHRRRQRSRAVLTGSLRSLRGVKLVVSDAHD